MIDCVWELDSNGNPKTGSQYLTIEDASRHHHSCFGTIHTVNISLQDFNDWKVLKNMAEDRL